MSNIYVNFIEGEYGMDVPLKDWVNRPQTAGLKKQRESQAEYKIEWYDCTMEVDSDAEILKEIIKEENTQKNIRNRTHNRQHNKYAKNSYHAPRNNKQFNHRRR